MGNQNLKLLDAGLRKNMLNCNFEARNAKYSKLRLIQDTSSSKYKELAVSYPGFFWASR